MSTSFQYQGVERLTGGEVADYFKETYANGTMGLVEQSHSQLKQMLKDERGGQGK